MRAADAAGWLAAFGAEDVAVTVRFPQLGGWEVTSWAVAPGDAEGSPALEDFFRVSQQVFGGIVSKYHINLNRSELTLLYELLLG